MKSIILKIAVFSACAAMAISLSGCSGKASWYELDSILNLSSESLQETLSNAFGKGGLQTSTVLGDEDGELIPQMNCEGSPEDNPFDTDKCSLRIQLVDDKTWDPQPNFFDDWNEEVSYTGQTIRKRAILSFIQDGDHSVWSESMDDIQKKCGFVDVIGDKEGSSVFGKGLNKVFSSELHRYGKCKVGNEDALWSIAFLSIGGDDKTAVSVKVEPLAVSDFSSYEDVQSEIN